MKRILSPLYLALLLIACGAGVSTTRPGKLKDAVYEYNRAIRWSNPATAARYIPTDQIKEYRRERAAYEDVVILDHEVLGVDTEPGKDTAEVSVRFQWRQRDGISIKTSRVRQIWRWDEASEHWLLHARVEMKEKVKAPVKEDLRF
jgi:hypothetical protein